MDGTVLADSEIAEFWKAHILNELYERRPRKQDFDADCLSVATGVHPTEEIEEFFEDLIDWLKEEGLIRVSQAAEGNAFGVSLTSKGQGLLAKAEAGWTGSIIDHLSDAAQKLPTSLLKGGVGMSFAALRSYYGI